MVTEWLAGRVIRYRRYAFIHFTDEEVCRKAHDASQELQYQSRTLVVMYGKKAGAVTQQAPTKRPASAKKCMCCLAIRYVVLSQYMSCFSRFTLHC